MRILRNIQLKILAVIFAIVLWFHVATNQRYDLEIAYQLAYVNIPDSLAMTEAPVNEVAVMMRGSGKGLLRLMWSERRWPVDLSRAKVGKQQVHIVADNVPLFGIQSLEVLGLLDTDTVTVTLDSLGQKTVPIRSTVEVGTTDGFICATDPVLTPDSTVLHGPRSNLARIVEVWTKPEMIAGVNNPVERLLPLLPPTSHGVTSGVSQIRFYQKVEPYLTRAFEAVPVHVDGQRDPEDVTVTPANVTVQIAGPQSAVVSLVADSIAVTCEPNFLTADSVFIPAVAVVPAHLRVLKLSPDSVTVERRERTRADSGD